MKGCLESAAPCCEYRSESHLKLLSATEDLRYFWRCGLRGYV